MAASSATTRRVVAGGRGRRFKLLPLPLALLLLLAIGGARAGLLWGGGEAADDATPSALAPSTHMEPVHLDWESIDCVLTTKDGRRKHLLKGVRVWRQEVQLPLHMGGVGTLGVD